jgi:hypothetical protein
MYRLGVSVGLGSGFTDTGKRRKVKSQTAKVGGGNFLLESVLRELQSKTKLIKY